ncbi:MAG: DNA polymerase-3 subunit delta' [Phenylobacterium sp.]|jgi:DNA polymerase-3 subunit delta'
MSLHPWLIPVINPLSVALQMNRLHHAVLLQGQAGMGKAELTTVMANGLVCDQTADLTSCGQCKSCLLFKVGNHPDSLFVKPQGASIGVDDIRKASGFVQQKAQISTRRVLILNNAELLTESAANALLKTLEEPNRQAYLLLTSDDPTRLLATIRSRCFKVTVTAPDKAGVYYWLQQQFASLDQSSFEWLFTLASQAPLKVAQWLSEDKLPEIELAKVDFQQWFSGALGSAQYQQKVLQSDLVLLVFHHLLVEQLRLQLTEQRGLLSLAQTQQIFEHLAQFSRDAMVVSGQNKALALLNLLNQIKTQLAKPDKLPKPHGKHQ